MNKQGCQIWALEPKIVSFRVREKIGRIWTKSRLKSHEKSQRHRNNVSKARDAVTLTKTHGVIIISGSDEVKLSEMKLSCEVAKHSPIMLINHLSKMITPTCVCTSPNCSNPSNEIKLYRAEFNLAKFGREKNFSWAHDLAILFSILMTGNPEYLAILSVCPISALMVAQPAAYSGY